MMMGINVSFFLSLRTFSITVFMLLSNTFGGTLETKTQWVAGNSFTWHPSFFLVLLTLPQSVEQSCEKLESDSLHAVVHIIIYSRDTN